MNKGTEKVNTFRIVSTLLKEYKICYDLLINVLK